MTETPGRGPGRLGPPIVAAVAGALALLATPPAAAQSLEKAYETELSVLRSERSELKKALTETEASSAAAARALQNDIESLTAELAGLRADNAARSGSRPGPVQQAEQVQLVQLLDQIEAAAAARGLDVPGDPDNAPQRLRDLIDAALSDLLAVGSLRIERGVEIFGADGVAERGDVLRVGEVAATRWGGAYEPLIRSLDGSLRVVKGLSGAAETTGSGQSVRAVLFDPEEPPAPGSYESRSAWGKVEAGGLLVWPLFALAFFMLVVAIERTVALSLVARRLRALLAALRNWRPPDVGGGRVPDSVDAGHWLAAPAVAVIRGASESRAALEERATEALLRVRPRVARRLSVLSVTAAAAPLIGLLGTVTGMITTFSVITEHGTGDPKLLSGGISEALITTQVGLAVAIPALLAHAALSRWATRLADTNQALVFDLIHAAHPIDHSHDHGPGHHDDKPGATDSPPGSGDHDSSAEREADQATSGDR